MMYKMAQIEPALYARIRQSAKETEHFLRQAEALDLETFWQGIHFVISGEPPITRDEAHQLGVSWTEGGFAEVLMGGEALPFRTDHAPIRYVVPGHVQVNKGSLDKWTAQEFADFYDPEEMLDAGIYPGNLWRDPASANLMVGKFKALKAYVAKAAERNLGLLCWIE